MAEEFGQSVRQPLEIQVPFREPWLARGDPLRAALRVITASSLTVGGEDTAARP